MASQESRSASRNASAQRRPSFERMEINENSPLISASTSEDGENEALVFDVAQRSDDDDDFQETKGAGYLVLLTLSIGGLQVAWATELSNGSPFLLSLGISKALMALVWIAGPLSGSLVQPYVGIKSDNCRLSWGKRKPFMVGGTIATVLSLLGLAWAREIMTNVTGIFGAAPDSAVTKNIIIAWAVLFIYVLDFSINTVQAGIRAFMVDCAPTHQQDAANAMASRVLGVGNILGYVFGYIDLPYWFWFFGNTQFKVLCVLACIALSTTVAISAIFITERDPRLEGMVPKGKGGVFSFFKALFKSIRTLPPQTRKVCEVQFFAWIGWFAFLFYCTTWIGELWVQPFFEANPHMTPVEVDAIYERSTRVGTFALLIWAITSLLSNVLLPFFVAPMQGAGKEHTKSSARSISSHKSYTTRVDRFLDRFVIPWLTLRRAWMISLIFFALAMFSTLLITSPTVATVAVAVIGIPWAMTLWAPFAIIAAEVSQRDALRRARNTTLKSTTSPHSSINGNASTDFTHSSSHNHSRSNNDIIDPSDNGDQAGVILGIHNMSVAAPQVFATLMSSAVFRFLQKPRGTPGDRSMPAVFALFGVFVCIAVWLASRLGETGASGAANVDDGDARHVSDTRRGEGS